MPLSLLNLAGALNALLLAAVLVIHPRLRRSSATHYLAGILALAAVIVALITLEHAELLWPTPILLWLEESLSLLAGPLLVGYVAQAVRGRHPPAWLFLPWLVHVAAFAVYGEALQDRVRIEHIMWVQMLYTAGGMGLWLRAWNAPGEWAPVHVLVVLGTFVAVHVAQVLRFSFAELPLLEDVVPWVATLSFFGLIGYAISQSRSLAGLVAPPVRSARRIDHEVIARRLEAVMREERPWTDSSLTLERLASSCRAAPAELSAVLNRHLGKTFYDYVNEHRVTEAIRLLSSPAEQRYSVHGIGLEAGFGSRSGFYKIFKAHTGLSPAEYRRSRLSI